MLTGGSYEANFGTDRRKAREKPRSVWPVAGPSGRRLTSSLQSGLQTKIILKYTYRISSYRLTPWGRFPGRHFVGGWVVSRVCLNTAEKRKSSATCRKWNARRHTAVTLLIELS